MKNVSFPYRANYVHLISNTVWLHNPSSPPTQHTPQPLQSPHTTATRSRLTINRQFYINDTHLSQSHTFQTACSVS